jgi:hypothetical protein
LLILFTFFFVDYLIGEVYVGRIIVKLHETLSKTKDLSEAANSDSSVSFVCDVVHSFFSSAGGGLLMPPSEDLLLTLFQLCAQSKERTHLPGKSLLLRYFLGNLGSDLVECECSGLLLES